MNEFKVQSKTEQVREHVKRLIDEGELRENEQLLPEQQLAKKLGISLITVRRAMDILEKDNYVHRVQGKGTFAGPGKCCRVNNINLVYPGSTDSNFENPFFGQVINGVNEYLSGRSIRLGLAPIPVSMSFADVINDARWSEFLGEGAIFMNYKITDNDLALIRKHSIKLVNIGTTPKGSGIFCVDTDHEEGGYVATSHLLKHGRKRILMLCNPRRHFYAYDVISGYIKALSDNNAAFDKKLIVEDARSGEAEGYMQMKRLLGRLDFDAFISFGDEATVGCINSVLDKNLRIPEDIALISYNDFPVISHFRNPRITAVSQPVCELGYHAARLLVEIREGRFPLAGDCSKIYLKPELKTKRSCGCNENQND